MVYHLYLFFINFNILIFIFLHYKDMLLFIFFLNLDIFHQNFLIVLIQDFINYHMVMNIHLHLNLHFILKVV